MAKHFTTARVNCDQCCRRSIGRPRAVDSWQVLSSKRRASRAGYAFIPAIAVHRFGTHTGHAKRTLTFVVIPMTDLISAIASLFLS